MHVTSDEILLKSTDLKTKLNKQSAIKLQSAKVGQDESLAIQRHTKKVWKRACGFTLCVDVTTRLDFSHNTHILSINATAKGVPCWNYTLLHMTSIDLWRTFVLCMEDCAVWTMTPTVCLRGDHRLTRSYFKQIIAHTRSMERFTKKKKKKSKFCHHLLTSNLWLSSEKHKRWYSEKHYTGHHWLSLTRIRSYEISFIIFPNSLLLTFFPFSFFSYSF